MTSHRPSVRGRAAAPRVRVGRGSRRRLAPHLPGDNVDARGAALNREGDATDGLLDSQD